MLSSQSKNDVIRLAVIVIAVGVGIILASIGFHISYYSLLKQEINWAGIGATVSGLGILIGVPMGVKANQKKIELREKSVSLDEK